MLFFIFYSCSKSELILRPTSRSVSLLPDAWLSLTNVLSNMGQYIDEQWESCNMTHNNEQGQISCSECNPNGYKAARVMMPVPGGEKSATATPTAENCVNKAWISHPKLMHELSALNEQALSKSLPTNSDIQNLTFSQIESQK